MLDTVRNIISSDATTQEMIAPVIDTLVATKAWSVGEEFIYAGTLYKVTTAIAVGVTIVLGSGGNADTADTITEQIASKEIHTVSETFTAAGNNFIYFPQGRHVISAAVSSAHPVLFIELSSNSLGIAYVNASTKVITGFTAGAQYGITYSYLEK